MSADDTAFSGAGAEPGLENEVGGRDDEGVPSAPLSRSQPSRTDVAPSWLILKRGQQRLALFRGWPETGLREAFQELRMTIGLALTAKEFAAERRLGPCDYLYVGTPGRHGSVFGDALRDLAQANWSIDQDVSFPVIDGGYQRPEPSARKGPRRASEQQERSRRNSLKLEA